MSKFIKREMITCEVCGMKQTQKQDHFRCYFCKKYHCDDCARSVSVYVGEVSRSLRSMRICKNCKPKKTV